jgi:hypothetical protein
MFYSFIPFIKEFDFMQPGSTSPRKLLPIFISSNDYERVELFLPSVKSSVILDRKAEGQPWINGEWALRPWVF